MYSSAKRILYPYVIAVITLALWKPARGSGEEFDTAALFSADAPTAPAPKLEPQAVSWRAAIIDISLVRRLKPGDSFTLNLFADRSVHALVERASERAEARRTLAGSLAGDEDSRFTMVLEDDAVAASVILPATSESYRIRSTGDGRHVVLRLDPDAFPPCAGSPSKGALLHASITPTDPDAQETLDANTTRGTCSFPPNVWDVMIVYTPLARTAAGGTNSINALCQLAVEETNEAYSNSAMNVRGVRLVYRDEMSYDENGTYLDHWNRLAGTADGFMDQVHSLRSSYRADLVCLWVDDGESCGIAECTADDSTAFSVVTWYCATGNYSFGHELGHNQGCAHDRGNDGGGCAAYSYSFGWRWFGNSGQQYRTVMAYAPGIRIQHFSNPNVLYDGQPTGVPLGGPNEAHNALTILNRALTVQNFRLTRFDIWVDFAHTGSESGTFASPYNTLAEGQANLIDGVGPSEPPTLWIKEGSTAETITFTRGMTVRACGGTVTIGQ